MLVAALDIAYRRPRKTDTLRELELREARRDSCVTQPLPEGDVELLHVSSMRTRCPQSQLR